MANPNMTLHPTNQMIRAAEFSKGVQVKENNRLATIDIPAGRRNMGFERLCQFLRSHPLHGAYFYVTALYPPMLNEWWYTCTVNAERTAITGTYNNGESHITITEEVIRAALNLPTAQEVGEGGFQTKLTKQEAREEAFPLIGQNTTSGVIRYEMFTGKWKFLFSSIVRCLGGKVGSLDQMNEFETHVFHSMVTGRRISYSKLYFDELISLTIGSKRLFNVPFIRVLSLCFENVLGTLAYGKLDQIFYEYPTPKLTYKSFNIEITEAETDLTPQMLQWIENPFIDLNNTESDHSDSEEADASLSSAEGGDEGVGAEDITCVAVSSPLGESGMIISSLLSLRSERIPSQTEAQPSIEMQGHTQTYPLNPPGSLENIHISSPTHIKAQMDSLIHEADGQEPPSSAAVHTTLSLLEQEVVVTAQTTQSQLSVKSLDTHVTAATQTHVVCIEEDVPILDIPVPSAGTPPSILTSEPIQKAIFTSSVLVHTNKPPQFLHTSAQVANTLLQNLSKVQTSTIQSVDGPSCQQKGPEDIPFTSSDTKTSQSEVSMTLLLQTIKNMSTQFDVKLSEMQTEIRALKENYPHKELADLKEMVQKLTTEIMEMKKERTSDIKGGLEQGPTVEGEQPVAAVVPESDVLATMDGQTQGEKIGVKTSGSGPSVGESDQPIVQADQKRTGPAMEKRQKKKQKFLVTDSETEDSCDKAAEAFEAEIKEEEMQAHEEEQQRFRADEIMFEKIQREQDRLDYIERSFVRQRWNSSIIHIDCFEDNKDPVLKCLLLNRKTSEIKVSRMHTLGLEEWKQIARYCSRLNDASLKALIKMEAVYNVNTAYYLNLIKEDEYKMFCVANNCHRGARSLGLESKSEHPVPSEIKFKARTYVKTTRHEGICYIDSAGEECFQEMNTIFNTSLYHCIALMNECKSSQCKPFRLKLISWLFNNLLRIEKIGGVEDKVEAIKKEYQNMMGKTDQEMERLMKWKLEKDDWVKAALKPSSLLPMKKPKSRSRRR